MATKFELQRILFNSKQDDHPSMELYITHVLETVQKLADMGKIIDDDDVAFVMLNGVSEDYENLVTSINQHQQDGNLRSEEVKLAFP